MRMWFVNRPRANACLKDDYHPDYKVIYMFEVVKQVLSEGRDDKIIT